MTCSGALHDRDTAPIVLWIGATASREFSASRAILRSTAELRDWSDVLPGDGTCRPLWGVVAASFPGEFTWGDWRVWRVTHPQCQWVLVCGPWCRGRMRSPEFVTRLEWHEFPGWWHGEVSSRADARAPRPLRAGLVTAHESQSFLYAGLLQEAGIDPVWVDPSVLCEFGGAYDFYVWDPAACARRGPLPWNDMLRGAAGGPVVVVAPSLRPDDASRWPGAASYLSHPLQGEIFLHEVRRIVASPPIATSLYPRRIAG